MSADEQVRSITGGAAQRIASSSPADRDATRHTKALIKHGPLKDLLATRHMTATFTPHAPLSRIRRPPPSRPTGSLSPMLLARAHVRVQEIFDPSEYYVQKPDDGTSDFIMQQTMMRIADPKKSLDFYCKTLGMK